MKRFFALTLALAVFFSASIPAVATENGKDTYQLLSTGQPEVNGNIITETADALLDGIMYSVTRETHLVGDGNSYKLITVTGGGVTVVADSRQNYFLENGVLKYYQIYTQGTRASRPTTIDHGLSIKPGWTYSYSTWANVTVAGPISATTPSVLIGLMGLAAGGPIGAGITIASIVIAFYSKDPYRKYDSTCYVRNYAYAYVYVLSQFAYITQIYTSDYVPVPNSSGKNNPTVYAF